MGDQLKIGAPPDGPLESGGVASGGVPASPVGFKGNKTYGRVVTLQAARATEAEKSQSDKRVREAQKEALKTVGNAVWKGIANLPVAAVNDVTDFGAAIFHAENKLKIDLPFPYNNEVEEAAAQDVQNVMTVATATAGAARVPKPKGPGNGVYVTKPEVVRKRPSWRQSEKDVGERLGKDYSEQKSFKDGKEVPYGTKGSTRPDWYKNGSSVEVKNYDLQTIDGQNRLVDNVANQAIDRASNLPKGTEQSLFIDIRGQKVGSSALDSVADRITSGSNGIIKPENITILR